MQNIEEVYKEYFDIVNRYLLCLTHNADLSEELTQETFFRAVKNINKFKGNCKISVWLCQIAKNLWLDEIHKNKKIDNQDVLDILEDNQNLEENIIDKTEKLELYNKIKKLDSQTKEVIYLRITGDLTFKEIGTILNKTENWARVTYYRGKNKLKEVD